MNEPTIAQGTAPQKGDARLYAAKTALWRSLRSICPPRSAPDGTREGGFEVDLHNATALAALSHWLVKAPFAGMDHHRGIFLRGPVGTGKSDLLRGLSRAIAIGGGEGFPIVAAKRIVYEFSRTDDRVEQGPTVVLRYSRMPMLAIDDLGTEEDGRHYGKTVNVIADLVAFRYDLWRQGKAVTFVTTNLTNAALSAKYDERTVSRLAEMMNVLEIGGPDRRQTSLPSPVERPDLFAEESDSDALPKEEALARLEAIRANIDRMAEEKSAKTEEERAAKPTRAEEEILRFKASLVGKPVKELEELLAAPYVPQYRDAIRDAIREEQAQEPETTA